MPVVEVAYCPHKAFPVGCYCRKPLPGLDPSLDFRQRTASCYMSSDIDWHEALRIQEEQERASPAAARAMAPVD